MHAFVYDQPAIRVIFGVGVLDRLPEEVERLGARRALILATPEQRKDADEAARRLGGAAAGVYAEAVMHVPVETARAAREDGQTAAGRLLCRGRRRLDDRSRQGDRARDRMPIVAVPTTYAGSEMTPIYGLTEGGLKKTGRDERCCPGRCCTIRR